MPIDLCRIIYYQLKLFSAPYVFMNIVWLNQLIHFSKRCERSKTELSTIHHPVWMLANVFLKMENLVCSLAYKMIGNFCFGERVVEPTFHNRALAMYIKKTTTNNGFLRGHIICQQIVTNCCKHHRHEANLKLCSICFNCCTIYFYQILTLAKCIVITNIMFAAILEYT